MSIEGGCQCCAIRYRIEGELMGSGVCHCRQCQYATGGGPNSVALAPKAGFTVTKGEPRRYVRKSGSGGEVVQVFCGDCGSPLWSEGDFPFHPVKAGSLDDPSILEPAIHLWTSEAQPWHRIEPGRMAFPENPPR
ncbi:GFA family protein [Caulobacter sp.]|uniref:GFA family protein n=1 Tax=Caulobacter sp. TaxID=78 RepID=UPI003BB21293